MILCSINSVARVSQNVWTNDDFGQHGRDLPPYCYTADYSTIPLNSQMLINGENVRLVNTDHFFNLTKIRMLLK